MYIYIYIYIYTHTHTCTHNTQNSGVGPKTFRANSSLYIYTHTYEQTYNIHRILALALKHARCTHHSFLCLWGPLRPTESLVSQIPSIFSCVYLHTCVYTFCALHTVTVMCSDAPHLHIHTHPPTYIHTVLPSELRTVIVNFSDGSHQNRPAPQAAARKFFMSPVCVYACQYAQYIRAVAYICKFIQYILHTRVCTCFCKNSAKRFRVYICTHTHTHIHARMTPARKV
jgi:hypothetical protein